MAILDFSIPFIVECDASKFGIGAVLMQKRYSIAFESRKLTPAEKKFNIYDKERLAIMHALAKFKKNLVWGKIVVKTNHKSLRHFLGQLDLNEIAKMGKF